MHPVQDKLNLERDEISGAGWILSRPTIRRSDDKSQRFSTILTKNFECNNVLDAVTNFFETLPKNERKKGSREKQNCILFKTHELVEERRVSSEE